MDQGARLHCVCGRTLRTEATSTVWPCFKQNCGMRHASTKQNPLGAFLKRNIRLQPPSGPHAHKIFCLFASLVQERCTRPHGGSLKHFQVQELRSFSLESCKHGVLAPRVSCNICKPWYRLTKRSVMKSGVQGMSLSKMP